jgi:hypothetical protein
MKNDTMFFSPAGCGKAGIIMIKARSRFTIAG